MLVCWFFDIFSIVVDDIFVSCLCIVKTMNGCDGKMKQMRCNLITYVCNFFVSCIILTTVVYACIGLEWMPLAIVWFVIGRFACDMVLLERYVIHMCIWFIMCWINGSTELIFWFLSTANRVGFLTFAIGMYCDCGCKRKCHHDPTISAWNAYVYSVSYDLF